MIKNRKYRIGFFVGGAIVAVFAFSALVMVLWNALMPQIFGVASLSYRLQQDEPGRNKKPETE